MSGGYGKPPKAYQFKPGQSGNPSGRRKKLPEMSTLMSNELKRSRLITEDGKRLKVQTVTILAKRLIDLALKGNIKALLIVMDTASGIAVEERRQRLRVTSDMTLDEQLAAYTKIIRDTEI